jgi:DeoR/GlpR family transcriptional regulator of sugar metabolism
MLAEQRQRLILERLTRLGAVSISDLSREWRVSRETVRRDIGALASRGALLKTHGGAVSLSPLEPDEAARDAINADGKRAVGRLAATLVPDGASVIIDSGTTTRHVAEALGERRRLIVYTNDLGVCRRLARRNDNRVILLGGELLAHEEATLSLDTIEVLSRYHADFAFIGVGGITDAGDITDFTRTGSELRMRMIAAARSAAVVADHTKFGRTTPVRIAGLEAVRWLIADAPPPRALRGVIEAKGVSILLGGGAAR